MSCIYKYFISGELPLPINMGWGKTHRNTDSGLVDLFLHMYMYIYITFSSAQYVYFAHAIYGVHVL